MKTLAILLPHSRKRSARSVQVPRSRLISGLTLAVISGLYFSCPQADAADLLAVDCETYARSYADAHVTGDPSGLSVADGGMRGAVAGGAWAGPGGAARGAVAGGALSVLDSLGDYPDGWRSLYDMAYGLCRNAQSPVNHRPTTLGDPSYRPSSQQRQERIPPLPARPRPPIGPYR